MSGISVERLVAELQSAPQSALHRLLRETCSNASSDASEPKSGK